MKLSLILEAIDRWSKPNDAATKSTKKLTKEVGDLGKASEKAGSRLGRFGFDAAKAERAGSKLGRAIRRMAISDWAMFTQAAHAAGRAIVSADRKLGNLAMSAGRFTLRTAARGAILGVGAVAAGAVTAGGMFARGVLDNSATFQNYEAELSRIEKSGSKARDGLKWLQNYGSKSPTLLEDLVPAFIEARRVAIDPMTGSFKAMEDKAIESKKTLSEIIAVVGRAKAGDFGGLSGVDVQATKAKGRVIFSYLNSEGKRVVKNVRDNARVVEAAVTDIFRAQAEGAADKQAGTLTGMFNRLKNIATSFQVSAGSQGFIDRVTQSFQKLLALVDKSMANGDFERWAKIASNWLVKLWEDADRFITQTDWKAVATGIGAIVSALVTVVGWIGKAASAWMEWQNYIERDRLKRIVKFEGTIFESRPSDAAKADARRRLYEMDHPGAPPAPSQPQVQRNRTGAIQWPRGSFAPSGASKDTWQRALRAAPAPVTGKISLDIRTDRGTTATPRKIAASGVDLEVNTGRAMAGAA